MPKIAQTKTKTFNKMHAKKQKIAQLWKISTRVGGAGGIFFHLWGQVIFEYLNKHARVHGAPFKNLLDP